MLKLISCVAMLLVLSACGGENNDAANTGTKAKASKSASSKLNSYLSKDKVCDALSSQVLQSIAGEAAEIKKSGGEFRNNFVCSYIWPRPDAEERLASTVKAAMASVTGDGPKLTMRDRMTEYQISVSLQKSKRSPNNFVPAKLSEEQIQAQIASAKKRTDARLSDEQKDLAGDAANSMIERMMRKNNENQEINGVGDAAYWSDLGTGSLQVLHRDVQITVTPILADTKEGDIENAKKIAMQLLN